MFDAIFSGGFWNDPLPEPTRLGRPPLSGAGPTNSTKIGSIPVRMGRGMATSGGGIHRVSGASAERGFSLASTIDHFRLVLSF
jgi:hypothetical protein